MFSLQFNFSPEHVSELTDLLIAHKSIGKRSCLERFVDNLHEHLSKKEISQFPQVSHEENKIKEIVGDDLYEKIKNNSVKDSIKIVLDKVNETYPNMNKETRLLDSCKTYVDKASEIDWKSFLRNNFGIDVIIKEKRVGEEIPDEKADKKEVDKKETDKEVSDKQTDKDISHVVESKINEIIDVNNEGIFFTDDVCKETSKVDSIKDKIKAVLGKIGETHPDINEEEKNLNSIIDKAGEIDWKSLIRDNLGINLNIKDDDKVIWRFDQKTEKETEKETEQEELTEKEGQM